MTRLGRFLSCCVQVEQSFTGFPSPGGILMYLYLGTSRRELDRTRVDTLFETLGELCFLGMYSCNLFLFSPN